MPLLIAALLGISAAIIVLYPLLGLDRHIAAESASASALTDDAERERSAKLALRDVDFDYRLGNLDEGDYIALRDRYERRALAALKTRYEREQALDALVDQQLAALRAKNGKIGKNGKSSVPPPTSSANPGKNGKTPMDGANKGGNAASDKPRIRRGREV